MPSKILVVACAAFIMLPWDHRAQAADVAELAAQVRKVGPMGEGHVAAIAAMRELSRAEAAQLTPLLRAFEGANPLATNWLRGAFEAAADRHLVSGGKLPQAELEKFLADTKQAPAARRLAYEWICRVDKEAEARLLPGFLNDPALELRRDAVARLIVKADDAQKRGDKTAYTNTLQQALAAARDIDQLQDLAKRLKEAGTPVDLALQLGFIRAWQLIGPFDNRNKIGFDIAYAPEKTVDLAAAHPGKEGDVKWLAHVTTDELGSVDLNKAIAKHMGAVAYAYAEFPSDAERPIELRLGCICANKVWLNGEPLIANHVYHAGSQIDQYIGRGRLKQGKNAILVKVLQNEQTEEWAQDWAFQLRVCDELGTAVPAKGGK